MDGARIIERNGEACAVLADDAARDGQRLGRCCHRVGNRDDPRRPVSDNTAHPWPGQLEANSGDPVFCPFEQHLAHAIVVVGLNRGQIDLRWRVEHQPQRIRPLENRCGRRCRERKFDAHGLAGLLHAGHNDGIRIRRRAFGICSWRALRRPGDFHRRRRRRCRRGSIRRPGGRR